MNAESSGIASLFHSQHAPDSPRLPASSRQQRILVADDEEATRCLCRIVLSRAGYTVDVAADGEQAWTALLTSRYDLLVTDHNMPHLTGLELVARMRAAGITLPVIINSGSLDLGEASDYPQLDLAAVLHKPFGFAEMLDAVQRLLRVRPDVEAGTIRRLPLAAAKAAPMRLFKLLASPLQPSDAIPAP